MNPPVLVRADHPPVLVVSGCHGATQRYRCWHAHEQLLLRGIPARVIEQWHPDLLDAGLGCGVVLLHRVAWDPGVQALIEQSRDGGGIVLFDIDDLVFEPEMTQHHHGLGLLSPDEQALYHDGVRRYRKTLLACDGAIAPTAYLAGRARALGGRAWVQRNVVDLEILRRSDRARAARRPRRDGAVVVGYASGSRTHDRDFAEAAGPALLRVMERRPELRLRLVGPLELGPEWTAMAERVERVEAVDWRDLPEVIAGFDISLAPLEIDNPFCRAKSELKWLEASACGVPTVAVATEAFAQAIEDGVDGLLARDRADWERGIERLAASAARRRAMGEAAAASLRARGSTASAAASLERLLAEARAVIRADEAPPPLPETDDGPLRVSLLMPEPPRGSGGHTNILRMVAGLEAAGHAPRVHVDPERNMSTATEAEAADFLRRHFPPSGAEVRIGRDFAPADVAIATAWSTARAVALAPEARTKLYLVQDFEPFFQPLGANWLAAEATYRLGLGHVTLGPYLAELLRDRYGARAEHFDFGVDHATYHPPEDEPEGPPRIVFYGRASTPRRGVALGLEALALVRAARPDVEIVLYGGQEPGLVGFEHVHAGVLTQQELADLYRSATAGLALSYTNLSFVPLEMAACGCPVVAADTEPARWFQRDGETCVLTESTAEALAAGLLRIVDDPALRARLSARGRQAVADLSWARSTARFVEIVEAYAAEDRARVRAGRPPATGPGAQRTPPRVLDRLEGAPGAWRALPPASAATGWPDAAGPDPNGAEAPGAGWPLEVRRDGLHRVDVLLAAEGPRHGRAVLSVREHAGAPLALATARVSARRLVPGGWTSFLFDPLPAAAGRTLHVGLHYEPPSDADEALLAEDEGLLLALDGPDGRVVHRSFGLEGPPPVGSYDPALLDRLQQRRRLDAAMRVRRAGLERTRVLSRAVGAWRRVDRTMPSVPMRPWPEDASGLRKALGGLRAYGPVALWREVAAWRRWQERPGEDGADERMPLEPVDEPVDERVDELGAATRPDAGGPDDEAGARPSPPPPADEDREPRL